MGVSAGTVGMISRCDLYEDYLELLNDRACRNDDKLRAMGLSGLSGEPLFWKIHSECRGFSIPNIASWSGLSQNEVRKMRQALDYQDYLKTNRKENNIVGRKPAVTQQGFNEVKQFLEDGYSDSDIIRLFNITEHCLTRIKRANSYEKFRGHRTSDQRKIWINDGLKEVILDGNNAHISTQQIAEELGISPVSVARILTGGHKVKANLITFDKYTSLKNHPKLIKQLRLRQAVQQANNYKDFSIRYYTNAKKVSWENKEGKVVEMPVNTHEVETLQPQKVKKKSVKEIRQPEEVIKTCDLGRAGAAIEAEMNKNKVDENKVEVNMQKEDITKLFEFINNLLVSDEKKYALQRYKYRGIFILLGELITGLLALGFIMLLK